MTELRPLAYGYMRVASESDDTAIRTIENSLKDYAEAHGFDFATIFHEFQSGSQAALDELIEELQRADAHTVIVPSLTDISPHPMLRSRRLDRLEDDAQAEVLELSDQ